MAMSEGSAETTPDRGGRVRLAIVGDVHGFWDSHRDILALKLLKPDLIIFLGDFGEENVELVQQIADVEAAVDGAEVAVILGNHDAWYSLHVASKQHGAKGRQSSGRGKEGKAVDAQLRILGRMHIGYRRLDFPRWRLSLLGARPFSMGPSSWNTNFYAQRYNVTSLEDSTSKILSNAVDGLGSLESVRSRTFLLVGHNGPSGLGKQPSDICGRDFVKSSGLLVGGDFGDPDLGAALLALRGAGVHVPLVMFGHMHHQLRYGGLRKMTAVGLPLVHPFRELEDLARSTLAKTPLLDSAVLSPPSLLQDKNDNELTQTGARETQRAQGDLDLGGSGGAHSSGSNKDSAVRSRRAETVHVNAAIVPRIRKAPAQRERGARAASEGAQPQSSGQGDSTGREHKGSTEHHFVVVELDWEAGLVDVVEDVWVHVGCACGTLGQESSSSCTCSLVGHKVSRGEEDPGGQAPCHGAEMAQVTLRERRFQNGVVFNDGFIFSAGC